MDTLGKRLKQLRKWLRINQLEMAEAIGLETAVAISKYESDDRTPDMSKLLMIEQKFQVHIEWLIKGESKPYIGKKLALAREKPEHKIELLHAATALNIPDGFLSAIENGEVLPADTLLTKMCILYHCNKYMILDEKIKHVPAYSSTGIDTIDKEVSELIYDNVELKRVIELLRTDPESIPEILKILEGRAAMRRLFSK